MKMASPSLMDLDITTIGFVLSSTRNCEGFRLTRCSTSTLLHHQLVSPRVTSLSVVNTGLVMQVSAPSCTTTAVRAVFKDLHDCVCAINRNKHFEIKKGAFSRLESATCNGNNGKRVALSSKEGPHRQRISLITKNSLARNTETSNNSYQNYSKNIELLPWGTFCFLNACMMRASWDQRPSQRRRLRPASFGPFQHKTRVEQRTESGLKRATTHRFTHNKTNLKFSNDILVLLLL